MPSIRAFLAHSSQDKEFALAVASRLDRAGSVIDVHDFQTGETFTDEIIKRLTDAGLFVLLASKASLTSTFVQLETNRAKVLIHGGLLSGALVFLIDDAITHNDVPPWLKQALIIRARNPLHVAQEIERAQSEQIRAFQQQRFVNRSNELAIAQRAFNPLPPESRPKLAIFYGPIGFGRRTLARRVLSDICGIRKFEEFAMQSGDDTADIAIKLSQLAETYADTSELKLAVAVIQANSNAANLGLIDEYLNVLSTMNVAPIFTDGGGMINPDGSLTDIAHNVASAIQRLPGVYAAFVSRRKPSQDFEPLFPTIRLKPLADEDMRDLLSSLLSRERVLLTQAQLDELTEYSAGYAPSAAYAASLAREYGIEKVLADKRALVQARIGSFTSDLRSDSILTGPQKKILVTLAAYSPMPLRELATSVQRSTQQLAEDLEYLIDTAFVYPDNFNRYTISEPLIEAVDRAFDEVEANHALVYASFELLLTGISELPDRLALERTRFRSFAARDLGGSIVSSGFIALANDFREGCVRAYRDQNYSKALEMARFAVELRPTNYDANRVLIQSYVKRRRFTEARESLAKVSKHLQIRDVHFFSAFILKGEGNFNNAIVEYLKAVVAGRTGIAINRELATCYFRLGDLASAKRYIAIANDIRGDNSFVLDLQMQIHLAANEIAAARSLLKRQATVDTEVYYLLRKSQVELSEGNVQDALDSARGAASKRSGIERECLIQRGFAEIAAREFGEARNTIRFLSNRYDDIQAICVILSALIFIAADEPNDAATTLRSFEDHSPTVITFLKHIDAQMPSVDLAALIQRAYMLEYNTDKEDDHSDRS